MNQATGAVLADDWAVELDVRVNALCQELASYLKPEQVATVREACYFAAEAHAGTFRKSGEPYVFHPIAVAVILSEVHFDHETLAAAILHDVIEDTRLQQRRAG